MLGETSCDGDLAHFVRCALAGSHDNYLVKLVWGKRIIPVPRADDGIRPVYGPDRPDQAVAGTNLATHRCPIPGKMGPAGTTGTDSPGNCRSTAA